MNKLLNSYSFIINKSGITNQEKFPQLIGSPFTINLVTGEGVTFTVEIFFNYVIEWPCLKIYKNNSLVQSTTVIRDYPTNLLLCEELNDYGLFYNEIDSVFLFYKLDDWYNSNKLNTTELEEKFKMRQI